MTIAVRHQMTGLLFCGTMINYIDRVNISIVAPVMLQDTGWSKIELGWVFSAFLIGNALLQFPAGVLADRWSGHKVLAIAFCGFSLFTLLTPLGARVFALLLALRFLVGAFESLTFPAVISINSRWIPRSEFGRAHTLSISGVTIGQVVAYPLTTWVMLVGSWEMVFFVDAVLGLIWVLAWLRYATDTPARRPRMTTAERSYIEADLPPKPAHQPALRTVLATPALMAIAVAFMCFAYVAALIVYWLPTFLAEARGLTMGQIALSGVCVLTATFIGMVGGGALADHFLRQGKSPQFARARLSGISMMLALPFLTATPLVDTAVASVACLVVSGLFFNGGLAGFATIAVEFDRHRAGSIFGALNACAAFAAIFGPLTAGYLLAASAGNWALPFIVAAVVAAVSAAILLVVPVRPIEAPAATASIAPAVKA